MATSEKLPPNYSKLDAALRSIGYSFDVAVADLVDNSIDAKASEVLIRLFVRKDGNLDLAIWDDGFGMREDTLKEAMRFGSDVTRDTERLGKFGLGLKLASLSQAREVRVVTIRDGNISGRAWLEQSIADGFICEIYDKNECKRLVTEIIPDRSFKPSATLVWWSHLYRVGHHQNRPEEHAQKLMRRIENHLALAFHRFLSGVPRKVNITIDIFDQKSRKAGIPIHLDPLNPFDYNETGSKGFPAAMSLDGDYKSRVAIKAHVWPPNSTLPGYRLPGGVNARQGFYFYRNNRLIQGGGWNGLRESEPHSSLARLEVDIAADFDIALSLDVKKVEIQLPQDLMASMLKARTGTGLDFKKYLSLADEAYRTRKATDSELPLIPSEGLPSELSKFLHIELKIKGTSKHRDLKIKWKPLDKDLFFDIDRDSGRLLLNRLYRNRLLHGIPASSADIPIVKCLLFLLLENELSSERMGPKIRERIGQVNRILVEAIKYERSPY